MLLSRRQTLCGAAAAALSAYGLSSARAEPLTLGVAAGLVGLALLQGAVSYVGGELMANAIGRARITDVRSWIQQAVAELEAFVSAELKRQLDAKVIEQMRANLSGISDNLSHYTSLKTPHLTSNKYLLESCDVTTNTLIPLSLNYDQAFFISLAAMAYRLITLTGLYKLDSDPGHIQSARPSIDHFVASTIEIRNRISAKMEPNARLTTPCNLAVNSIIMCFVYLDGQKIAGGFWVDKTRPPGPDAINKKNQILPDVQKDFADFTKNSNSSIQLIINAYDSMCRAIGDSYSPAPVTTEITEIPRVIKMKGALVGPIR